MATSSRLPPSPTAPFRSKTTAAAARSTGTPPKNASTGSSFSASCTRAANTTTTKAATTTSRSAPTAWARAPRSTPLNTWMSTSGARATNTPCISRRAKSSAPRRRHSKLSLPMKTAPAPPLNGAPTSRFSRPSTFLPTGIAKPCVARQSSMPTSPSAYASRAPKASPRKTSATPRASRTTCWKRSAPII